MYTKFETYTLGDLSNFEKDDLDNDLNYYSGEYEFSSECSQEILNIIKKAVLFFKKKLPIFDKIHIQLVEDLPDCLGMYIHESVLRIPVVLLSMKNINDCVEEGYPIGLVIRTTIFHELGHAIVDLDNQMEFKEGENILQFEDGEEEDYVEEFAHNLQEFGDISDDILELMNLYKKNPNSEIR